MSWDDLHNAHLGRTGVIIGNGPSLNQIPRKFLKKYPTFGTNRIYLMSKFAPTYYCSVNPLVIEQYEREIREVKSKEKFIAKPLNILIPGSLPLKSIGTALFSFAPSEYIYEGYTVTYVCMQLAYWMGFETVLLVGVDHRFTFEGRPNEQRKAEGPDLNHFHPDYFSNGVQWNNPDLERSAHAYGLAKTAYEKNGRRIINLTPDTALDVFEKGSLSEW